MIVIELTGLLSLVLLSIFHQNGVLEGQVSPGACSHTASGECQKGV